MASRLTRGGRKITTWTFKIAEMLIKLDVRLVEKADRTFFYVEDAGYDISLESDNIDELKKQAYLHLNGQLKIEWQEFYYLSFSGELSESEARRHNGRDRKDQEDDELANSDQLDMQFEYRKILIGTKPNGTKCHKTVGDFSIAKEGEPETGIEHSWRAEWKQRALLPVTPANTKAVQAMLQSLKEITSRVHQLLDPDKIQKNINAGFRLLPAPEKPKKAKKR